MVMDRNLERLHEWKNGFLLKGARLGLDNLVACNNALLAK